MHRPSRSTVSITAGLVPILFIACGGDSSGRTPDASLTTGVGGAGFAAGGSQSGGGQTAAGGAPANGGVGGGERTGSGGAVTSSGGWGAGGVRGSGGAPGSGGLAPVGGTALVAGGAGGRPDSGGDPAIDGRADDGVLDRGGQPAAGGSTGTGLTATGGAPAAGGTPGTTTRPARFVGNIDTQGSIRSDFASYWDQFTPENAGKWASVQGSSANTFNWNSLDAMVKHCEDNHLVFKEHTFVWGASQPSWMSSLTTTTGPAAVQNWMKAFCDRYPNTRLIDVVNEPPPHTVPPYANAIGGGTNTTWDWIANSFKWARQACPNAVLILNDYQNAELASSAQHIIDIVTAIKKLDAPIDAVGCQTHEASTIPSATLKANIDAIASATSLPVYITEYDINLADDEKQRQQYQDHFTMFMGNPNIAGVTVWGYIVGQTWRTNTGLITQGGTMRPAMTWLMEFLGR